MLGICRHKWGVVKETILPSAYEQIQEGGQTVKNCQNIDYLFRKTLVIYMKCKTCSKTKIQIVTS